MKAKLTLENGTEFNVTVDESKFNVTVDESKLKKETSKRWKPEKGEEYWPVSTQFSVKKYVWVDDEIDAWQYSQRNVFQTKEEADQHLAYLKARAAILDHADEVNEGWVPDWSNPDEGKRSVVYGHRGLGLHYYCHYGDQNTAIVYYKSEEAAEDAINKVGDAYLIVLGVEK